MRMRLNLLFPADSTNRRFSFSAPAKYPPRYATGLARSVAWYKTHLWNRKGDVSSVFNDASCFNYTYVIRDVSRTRHRHDWRQVNSEMIYSFQQESLLRHFSKNDPTGYEVILLFIAVSSEMHETCAAFSFQSQSHISTAHVYFQAVHDVFLTSCTSSFFR